MRAALFALALVAAHGAFAQSIPGSPVQVSGGGGGVSGVFNNADLLIGNVANTSIENATAIYSGGALKFQVNPTGIGGFFLVLDNDAINSMSGFVVRSHGGLGDSVNANFGYLGSTGRYGIYASGSNGIDIDVVNTATLRLRTNDTTRAEVTSDGGLQFVEQAAPSATASRSMLHADSTAHALELSNNGDTSERVRRGFASYTTSNTTNATTSYTDLASVSLSASSKYACEVSGNYSETVAGDGFKVRVNPGATSVTSDATSGELYDADTSTGGGGLHTTGAASDVGAAGTIVELSDTNTVSGHFAFHYRVNTNTAMTWKVQVAQQSHTTGTVTVPPGATVVCEHLDL